MYAWILHGFLWLVRGGSPYFRAALLTTFYMVGALALLLALAEQWLSAMAVVVLGTLPVVWRYGVLPDVFALHMFLTTGVAYCVLKPTLRYRALLACAFFGLAAANHQTIIFMAPAIVLVLVEERSPSRAVTAALAGAALCCLLYASLLWFDTDSPHSWGHVANLRDVLRHFRRADYGTLKLFGGAGEAPFWVPFRSFLETLWPLLVVVAAALVLWLLPRVRDGGWITTYERRAWLVVAGCLTVYCTYFIGKINFPDEARFEPMRERFFLFPAFVFTALAVRSYWATKQAAVGAVVIAAMIMLNIASGSGNFALAHDTVVEDWARNFLDTAAAGGRPAFAIVDGDTETFALHYVQAAGDDRDVIVMSLGNSFDFKSLRKIRAVRPQFAVDEDAVMHADNRGFVRLMVAPNIAHYDFAHSFHFTTPRLKTIFYPCGRRLVEGQGVEFAPAPAGLRLNPPVYAPADINNENNRLYSEYADFYLAQGRASVEQGLPLDAIAHYQAGLRIVPWCEPCRIGACELERQLGQPLVDCEPDEQ